MARKRLTTEEELARLQALDASADPEEMDATLRAGLASGSAQVITKAAQVAAELGKATACADLEAACARLLDRPAKADPGCLAKTAIVETLAGFEAHCPDLYRGCLQHVQMEPVFGGRVDTADHLRGVSAQALVQCLGADGFADVLPVMVDAETAARRGAVRSLAAWGDRSAELLLRLFILARPGDDALADAFAALLEVAPERSAAFVAKYLASPEVETAEAAALALGASRAPDAFPHLRAYWDAHILPADRATVVLAIALTRCDAAVALLADTIAHGARELAVRAVEASRHCLHEPAWRDALAEAVARRSDEEVAARWERALAEA